MWESFIQVFHDYPGIIEHQIKVHGKAVATWVTQEVMARHDEFRGKDRDWAVLCAHSHVRATVRKRVQAYKPEQDDNQPLLPGFESLQSAYMVVRNGEQAAVRVDLLTPVEVRAKAEEQRRMGRGCFAHADELERYADHLDNQQTKEQS